MGVNPSGQEGMKGGATAQSEGTRNSIEKWGGAGMEGSATKNLGLAPVPGGNPGF